MASDVTVTSQMQMYADVSAINTAISGINNFIQKLEQLENTANRVFSVFNNMSSIHFPTLSDIPPMPQPPQPPEPPQPPQPPEPPQPPQPPEPPQPPQLNWNPNGNIDIFNTAGVERYRSEISAVDNQMQQLVNNQTRVSNLSSNMDIIPDNMINDVNSVNQRILALSQSIKTIQDKGLGNMGADRANSQIEQLREQLNAALQRQTNLNNAIRDMNPSAAQREFEQLNHIINNANRHIRDNINSQNQFNNAVKNGENAANNLLRKLRNIVGTYLTIRGVGQVINLSDKMTQATARLTMLIDDKGSAKDLKNKIEDLKSKVFDVAQSSRADYIQTMDLVGKLGVQAGKAFTSNDELLAFTDQLNKHFAIAGTNAEGISGATLQLTQALGSGVLRGQELNSVFTQAPTIMQNIAEYLGKDIGQLRKMAEEGMLTADVVKKALFYCAKETDKKFNAMPMTFSQIWTNIKNNAIIAFQPILNKLSEIANSESFQVLVQSIINGLSTIGTYLSYVFEFVCSIAGFFSENWSNIGPVIKSIAINVGLLIAAYTAFKIIMGIVNFVSAIHSAYLALQAKATFTATAAQYGFNASLLACPITWIIVAIIAFIAVITYLINKLGGLKACWELVKMHIEIGLINLQIVGNKAAALFFYIIDSLVIAMIWCKNKVLNAWDSMALGISGACNGILNFIGDMKAGALQILQDMINGAIGLINDFIGLLNNLPGVNISAVQGVTFGAEAGLRNTAEKIARTTELAVKNQQVKSDIANRENELNQAIANREKNWNEAMAENSVLEAEKFFAEIKGNVAYNAAKLENQNNDTEKLKEKAAGTDIPNVGEIPDLAGGNDKGGKGNNSVDRVGKVDKVGGTVDISSEELKRMRDIYENDIIQEVYVSNTTPQVNIQFGDVRETADVDEMIRLIKSKIKESLNISAEGVH